MSAIEKFKHVLHEYERVQGKKDIYKCSHPKCTHYTNRIYLIGNEAQCPKCKSSFVLTWPQLRNKKPVCPYCTRSPKSKELALAREAAFKVLNDLPEELKNELLNITLE